MTKFLLPLFLASLWIGLSRGQTSPQPQANGPGMAAPQASHFEPGTKLRAQLDKTIDAKKAKPGDPVLAKTLDELRSGSEVVAPRGSKIVGHVVAASPHEKGSPSRLEIAFDKLDLENGSAVPLKATIEALAKPAENAALAGDDTGASPSPGGTAPTGPGNRGAMPQGGMGQPGGLPNAGATGNPSGTTPQHSTISPNAEGVVGMPEMSLARGPNQDSILTSEKHNVKLDSGTQMILRVE
jgi:hypothetical protein